MSNRLKFFLSHLSLSLMISLIVVGIIFFVWYPTPLATAVGVTQIFLMMLAIDVVVGPLLGWLVYKEGKKTLKFDLTIIIAIQITALCYGVYSIEQGRPAWVVLHADRFELVRKNDIILDGIDQAPPQFQHVPWTGPQLAAVESALNAQKRQTDMFTEVLGGISIAQQPERYVDFFQAKKQILLRAKELKELKQYNDEKKVSDILLKYPQATAFMPLKANAIDMTVLVNRDKGEIIKIVDLRPWN